MFTDNQIPIYSSNQVGSLRMFFAGLVMLPIGLPLIKKIKNIKDFLFLTIVGFCGNFFPAFLFTYAETGISSGLAGMLNSFTPMFTMILGYFLFQNKITFVQFIGLLFGIIGIGLLVMNPSHHEATRLKGDWTHSLAVVLATLCYAMSLNSMKFKLQHFKPIEISSLAFTITFLPAVLMNIISGSTKTMLESPFAMQGLIYIAILSVFGTAIAVVLYSKLVAISSTVFSSSVTYIIPIVAVIIGFSDGEKITLAQIGGMFVILIGIFVANYWTLIFKKEK